MTTLYFGETSAGTEDGTSWANRAAFLVGGTISTLISGHSFAGGILIAKTGGTHSLTTGISSAAWASPPTAMRPLFFVAVDANGDDWVNPDPGWVSSQPAWDDTGMPVIATTTNIQTGSVTHAYWHGFKMTATGRGSGSVLIASGIRNCIVQNSGAATSAMAVSLNRYASNVVARCTGTSYNVVVSASTNMFVDNVRCEGNSAATGGGRTGFGTGSTINSSASAMFSRLTVINTPGAGIRFPNTNAASRLMLNKSLVYGSGAEGIALPSNSSPTQGSQISNSVIVDNGGWGMTSTNGCNLFLAGCRMRDNTSGNVTNPRAFPTTDEIGNNFAAGLDADEFVNAAGGDFRIKATSPLWGTGLGPGDEIPTPGDIADAVWAYVDRTLT